jgi:3-dehydroquinate synthase
MTTQRIYAGEEIRWASLANERLFIVTDARTNGFCLPILLQYMPFLVHAKRIVVPAGEAAKQLDVCTLIWDSLLEGGAQNNDIMLVLGGGALCDVASFCASVYKRGMRLRLIPTTLLAMVDASLGGKTAINLSNIKNNIGSYYPAEAVYCQPAFFKTLPERELHSGIAEMVKHALLESSEAWERIQTFSYQSFFELEAIQHAQALKLKMAEADPYDRGIRQALNLGHSLGHAIEACSLQSPIPWLHGEAIMAGLQMELWLSVRCCHLNQSVYDQYRALYRNLFPNRPPITFSTTALLSALQHDKKNRNSIRMSLISSPGVPQLQVSVEESLISEAIHENRYQ